VARIVPFVDLVAQYESIAEEIDQAFHEVTASAQYMVAALVLLAAVVIDAVARRGAATA